jgi:hypothetical protein
MTNRIWPALALDPSFSRGPVKGAVQNHNQGIRRKEQESIIMTTRHYDLLTGNVFSIRLSVANRIGALSRLGDLTA